MNRRLLLQLAAAMSLTLASILAIAAAGRADAGGIEVRDVFSRASIGQTTSGVVYLTLINRASRPDRLVAASTPVAARTDLHMTLQDGDVVRMRRLDSMAIAAGEELAFTPRGAHIMLSGLEAPLHQGDSFELTLQFEAGGPITVEVPVRSATAGTADDAHGHDGH